MPSHDDLTELADETIATVREWMRRGSEPAETRSRATGFPQRLSELLAADGGLEFATAFADDVIRVQDSAVAGRSLERLSRAIPAGLPWFLRSGVLVGGGFGAVVPRVVVPVVRRAFERMIRPLYLDAAPERLEAGIKALHGGGVRPNLTLLGPAVLGDKAADRRVADTIELLSRPDVHCVSLAVSSVVADEPLWGFEQLVSRGVSRLAPLYEFAAASPATKLVNLVITDPRQLELALVIFMTSLDARTLKNLEAGITVPAGALASSAAVKSLTEFATRRRAVGGAGIKVSVSASDDLVLERANATLSGWREAAFPTQAGTDANLKRILDFLLTPERTDAARVGVISHNLFELAYANNLARARGVDRRLECEMPLGLVTPAVDAARAELGSLLLSAPVVSAVHDVAPYLVGMFRQAADGAVRPTSPDPGRDFDRESDRFLASLTEAGANPLDSGSGAEHAGGGRSAAVPAARFTDPADATARRWAASILGGGPSVAPELPQAAAVLEPAAQAGRRWGARGGSARAVLLRGTAEALGTRRGQLIDILARAGGALIAEADREVSEAAELADYYAGLAEQLDAIENATFVPAQLTVVLHRSARLSDSADAVLAALAAGSAVVLIPDRPSRLVAAGLVGALWEGGVPREVLQVAGTSEDAPDQDFVGRAPIARTVLVDNGDRLGTGHPESPLRVIGRAASSIIVTPSADLDAAVRDVVTSAFRDAGQGVSATNLVILVGSVAQSERFRSQLIDAVSSLRPGYPQSLNSTLGPLVSPAAGDCLAALTVLEEGERWLVEPRALDETGCLWSPGLREPVLPGSSFHRSDARAPVLGIMHAETLADAIAVQNDRGSAPAAGLHSLEESEIATWLDAATGRLFVNRDIPSVLVGRQPNILLGLGAWEPEFAEPRSSVVLKGIGDRVTRLIEAAEPGMAFLEFDRVRAAARDDQQAWDTEFGLSREIAGLGVQRNVLRYRRVPATVRLAEGATTAQLVRVIAAATLARARITVSSALPVAARLVQLFEGESSPVRVEAVVVESDADWHARVRSGEVTGRIRLIGGDRGALLAALGTENPTATEIHSGPVTTAGRLELLTFLREQSVSITVHRYGRIDAELSAFAI